MAEILHMVTIKAAPDAVFAALSEQKGLAGWWTEQVQAEPKVGSVSKFRFGSEHEGSDMKILALEKAYRVHWRCVSKAERPDNEWVGTELTFELQPAGDRTEVRFSHRRWMMGTDFLRYCSAKWAVYLVSLKQFVETGKGMPFPRDIGID